MIPKFKPSEGAVKHELTLVRKNGERYTSSVWQHPDLGYTEEDTRAYLIRSIRYHRKEEEGDRFE